MTLPVLVLHADAGWTWAATWMGYPRHGRGASRDAALADARRALRRFGVTSLDVIERQ